HHQAECILASRIIDERLNNCEGTSWGQGIICLPNEHLLLLEVPVVQDHPHRDDVRLGQRIGEKVASDGPYAVGEARLLDLSCGYRRDLREIEGDAAHVRIRGSNHARKLPGGTTDIAKSLEPGEVEFAGKFLEVSG